MSIHIIATVGVGNHVIGVNGGLPWSKIASDTKHFLDTITGHPVVMGRKTWDSLPAADKPLLDCNNIVLTRNASLVKIERGSVIIHENIDIVLEIAKTEEVFVIGGAEIYQLFMPHAQTMHLTGVHGEFKGDTYFPAFSLNDWFESTKRRLCRSTEDSCSLTFCTFSRKAKRA